MSDENKALARREIEELFNHTGDLDVAEEVYAPDFVGHDPTMPEDLHGVFLLLARTAIEGAPCPSDEELAQAYGTRSPGRVAKT